MLRLLVIVALAFGFSTPAFAQAGDDKPIATMRPEKPSGFWGGAKRGEGGAYRWKLLYVGVGLVLLTGAGILVVLKRTPGPRPR